MNLKKEKECRLRRQPFLNFLESLTDDLAEKVKEAARRGGSGVVIGAIEEYLFDDSDTVILESLQSTSNWFEEEDLILSQSLNKAMVVFEARWE